MAKFSRLIRACRSVAIPYGFTRYSVGLGPSLTGATAVPMFLTPEQVVKDCPLRASQFGNMVMHFLQSGQVALVHNWKNRAERVHHATRTSAPGLLDPPRCVASGSRWITLEGNHQTREPQGNVDGSRDMVSWVCERVLLPRGEAAWRKLEESG